MTTSKVVCIFHVYAISTTIFKSIHCLWVMSIKGLVEGDKIRGAIVINSLDKAHKNLNYERSIVGKG
jgi:hypothetical protein